MKAYMIAIPTWLFSSNDFTKGSKQRFNDETAIKGYIVSIVNDTYLTRHYILNDDFRKRRVVVRPKSTSQKYFFSLIPTLKEINNGSL